MSNSIKQFDFDEIDNEIDNNVNEESEVFQNIKWR